MSPARYGKNIRLIRHLSHELYKKVLDVFFSYTFPYIETILIRMHRHTPGTNTALLITKKIGFVGDQKFSQATIRHIVLYIRIYI